MSSTLGPGWTALAPEKLPEGWGAAQLRDICSFQQGGKLGLTKESHYTSSGTPAYSAAGQDGYVEKTEFIDTSAVILSAIGANCGRCFLAEGDFTTLANIQVIVPDQRNLGARFLHYRVNREGYWPRSGSAQPFIKPRDMKECWIAFPNTTHQSKIAEVLDTLDAAIRGTEAVVAKLKAMKQGLLHDLLTRGIEANGNLRPPHTEAPHLYKETPLGWLPKEWDALKIEEIGDVRTGKTPPAEDPAAWGDATPFVTPGDIAHSLEISKSERHLSVRGEKYVPKVPAGATLVVCIGSTIGKVGYVSEGSGFNQQINAVVPHAQHEPAYIFSSICKSIFQLHRLAGLQAVPIVNKSEFQKIRIPVAPKPEQSEIIERLNQLERREASEETELKKMRASKSGLMDDLLSGRVPVTPLLEGEAAHGT